MKIRIATRKSELALWQARHVAGKLESVAGVTAVELVPLSTRGDEILDKSLQKIGGKGLFIKELEVAMQSGDADIAVHSMKDVPAEMPQGFCIASVLDRADPTDAFVSGDDARFADLPAGARIGSSSLRRQAQLRSMRPDIDVIPLRGNVNTRLAKLADGKYDAIILATAGLQRLGLANHITECFSPNRMLPAAAQGVIGIECLDTRGDLRALLAELEDPASAATTAAERAVAATLDANCQSPVASFAEVSGDTLSIRALVASEDGRTIIRESVSGDTNAAAALGRLAAEKLLANGAAALLQEIAE
ncbi:MAG: hydroxymethylbilane synthase [Woeseiaceae bacterium]